MGKVIMLREPVYNRLEEIRVKRETFSEAVDRLISIHDGLGLITSIIQGQKQSREYQAERLKETKAIDR